MNKLIQLDELCSYINQKTKKVLIVTNKNSYTNNGFDQLIEKQLEVSISKFSNFSVNPKLEEIISYLDQQNLDDVDFVLGVGGGSALDVAKSLFYFTQLSNSSRQKIIRTLTSSPSKIKREKELALIPTTSGSGSEATHFSVLYYQNQKYSLASQDMYPNFVVLDTRFTKNLPPQISAYTYMDAIVHAIESYWSISSNKKSKEISLKALEYLVPYYKEISHSPDQSIRKKIMFGAYFSGQAINQTKTTAAHAFSYYLTGHHGIPHGQAVGICILFFFIPNAKKVDLDPIFNIFGVNNANELRHQFIIMLKELKLLKSLEELQVDIEALISTVNLDRLKNNPVSFTKDELNQIFNSGSETMIKEV